jgi:hypothetical protein
MRTIHQAIVFVSTALAHVYPNTNGNVPTIQ